MPFPSSIRNRADFNAARRSPSFGTPGFLLVRRERDDSDGPRLGLTITKKIGNAATRNRIRRRLKEAARLTFGELALNNSDYLIIARGASATRSFALLLDDMKRALLRLSKKPR